MSTYEPITLTQEKLDRYPKIDVQEKLREIREGKNRYKVDFPLFVFPVRIQEIFKSLNRCYGFPIDYYGSALVTVAGALIGNAYEAQYKPGWSAAPVLYACIVGPSGIGKSKSLKPILQIIQAIENKYDENYLAALEQYNHELEQNQGSSIKPKEPQRKEILINESTLEGLQLVLSKNPKGIILYQDEFSSWLNSMNMYRSGGNDEEFYMKSWDNETTKVTRAGKTFQVKNAFVSVIGGTTPSFLKQLAGGNRLNSGFFNRILFAWPNNVEIPLLPKKQINPDPKDHEILKQILLYLHQLPSEILPGDQTTPTIINKGYIPLTAEAQELYREYVNENRRHNNSTDDETVNSIYAKMDSIALRLSIILEFLKLAEADYKNRPQKYSTLQEMEAMRISLESMAGAIDLANYYRINILKVLDRVESPVDNLPTNRRELYGILPDSFTYSEAIDLATEAGISKSTVKRLLNNREVLKKSRGGIYEKLFEV
jgi:hypothetical protein